MRLPVFFLLILFTACSPEEEDTLSFDDLTSESEKYDEGKREEKEPEKKAFYFDSISVFSQNLIDSLGLSREKIRSLDSAIFSDRFGAKTSEKWYYRAANDSLVFFRWQFRDSIKTFNTFYNWIDCYGSKCKSIQVGSPLAFSKRATLFLVREKELFFVESDRKIDPEKYLAFFDSQEYPKKWKYLMIQQPRKKSEWFSRSDKGELVPIKL